MNIASYQAVKRNTGKWSEYKSSLFPLENHYLYRRFLELASLEIVLGINCLEVIVESLLYKWIQPLNDSTTRTLL